MKIKHSQFSFPAGIMVFTLLLSCHVNKYSPETEQKIKQVEKSLAGWVQTDSTDIFTLSERMSKYKITGLSIAVINNYKVEWAKGYGFADLSESRPVTEKTLFQAASISKSLNATGILKLVGENKLDLNSDINDYLITWKFPYNEKSGSKKITLKHLLSHTGGLTIHGFPGYAKGEEIPSVVMILDGQKPANTEAVRSTEEPGRKVIYSGGGTTISQLVVMDVTKQPYEVFMKENVLDPLGMTSSSYQQPPPAEKHDILATGYKADGTEVTGKYHIYPEQAAAGLWTNPSDLARFIIETQLAYKGESSKVLSQEMTKLRVTPVLEDAALGLFVNSRVTGSVKYFNHNGGNVGFSCTAIGSLGEGKGVVIMTNSDNGAILEEIANSVATVYKWKDYYLPEYRKIVSVDTSLLYRYIGKYDVNGSATAIMKYEDGLAINPFSDVLWKLNFTSDSDFFVREFRGNLRFKSDRNNNVTGLTINELTAKKIE